MASSVPSSIPELPVHKTILVTLREVSKGCFAASLHFEGSVTNRDKRHAIDALKRSLVFEEKPSASDVLRFLKKVEKTQGCWVWLAGRDRDGYGKFAYNRISGRAHKFSFLMHKGAIPPGKVVRHTCDNPSCVNPSHLLLGTIIENNRDTFSRGRQAKGEKIHASKLTAEKVRKIRAQHLLGESQRELAAQYGVSQPAIGQIVRGKFWKSA